MAASGVFAVARGVFDHPVFADETFTEREAWIWMVGEAAWKPTRVRVGTAMISLVRGEASHSIRFLAEKWGWHRAKVERFFRKLKTETMVTTRVETGVTVITICKYNEYQRVSLPIETPPETISETPARQGRDREEDSEYIEEDSVPNGTGASVEKPAGDEVGEAVKIYDQAATSCGWPKIVKLTPSRRTLLKARIRDAGGIDGWRSAMAQARASPFLSGASGRSNGHENWRPNIDFFCQGKNFMKLIEGQYGGGTAKVVNGNGKTYNPADDHDATLMLKSARERRQWSRPQWGPMPGELGCKIPVHLLQTGDGDGWSEWGTQK